jgi:hypothetical protein
LCYLEQKQSCDLKKILETTSARALENKWAPQMLVILLLDLDGCIIIDTSVLLADVSDFALGFFGRDSEFAFLGFFKITFLTCTHSCQLH